MPYPRFVLLLCIAFSCTVTQSFCQIKDGFIIQPGGDYRYGQITVNEKTQFESVLFKESSQSEFILYNVETINGYGIIDGLKFITNEITVDGKLSKVFLKAEFEGIAKLYSYKERFFVEKQSFIEITEAQGENNFKRVITELFSDCKNFDDYSKGLKFTQKKLYEAFKGYNECVSSDSKFVPHFEFSVEPFAGIELNNTKLTAVDEFSFANDQTLKDKTLLALGFTVNLSVPQVRGLYFSTGLTFYDQKFYLITNSISNGIESTDKLNLDYKEFLVPVNIQYGLPLSSQTIKPYFKVGVSFPFTTGATMKWEHEEDTGSAYYYDTYDFSATVKQGLILNLSAGTYFSILRNSDLKGFLEIGYQKTSGDVDTTSNKIELTGSRINLLVGIRF